MKNFNKTNVQHEFLLPYLFFRYPIFILHISVYQQSQNLLYGLFSGIVCQILIGLEPIRLGICSQFSFCLSYIFTGKVKFRYFCLLYNKIGEFFSFQKLDFQYSSLKRERLLHFFFSAKENIKCLVFFITFHHVNITLTLGWKLTKQTSNISTTIVYENLGLTETKEKALQNKFSILLSLLISYFWQ